MHLCDIKFVSQSVSQSIVISKHAEKKEEEKSWLRSQLGGSGAVVLSMRDSCSPQGENSLAVGACASSARSELGTAQPPCGFVLAGGWLSAPCASSLD